MFESNKKSKMNKIYNKGRQKCGSNIERYV